MTQEMFRRLVQEALKRAFLEGVAPGAPLAWSGLVSHPHVPVVLATLAERPLTILTQHDLAAYTFWRDWFAPLRNIPHGLHWDTPLDDASSALVTASRAALDARPKPRATLQEVPRVLDGTYDLFPIEQESLTVRAALVARRATCVQVVPLDDAAARPRAPRSPVLSFPWEGGGKRLGERGTARASRELLDAALALPVTGRASS